MPLSQLQTLVLLPICVSLPLALWLWNRASRSGSLPPGPLGLPLIGSAPWLLFKRRDRYFTELSRRYGEIFTVRFGFFSIVVLNSTRAIKEGFGRSEDIAGRGLRAFTKFLTDGRGVASSEGRLHGQQRRYCLRVLRDFGLGRIDFEGSILDEVGHFTREIDRRLDKPQPVSELCSRAIANVIGRILFGARLPYGGEQMRRLVLALHELNAAPGGVLLLNATTLLDPLADMLGVGRLRRARQGIKEFLRPIVQRRRLQVEAGDMGEATDFLGAYLIEQHRRRAEGEGEEWDDRQLEEVLVDLMAAGSDTSRSTLVWSLNFLSGAPAVQRRLRQELLSALGDGAASCSDLPRLPRLDAAMQEVLRLSALVPTAVPHCCTKDTTLLGYRLPKGTMVLANTHCLSRDPAVFQNPEQFDPFAHFLATEVTSGEVTVVNKENILPFSYGRRSCIGESLSRMELLLFLSALLQRYDIQLPPGATADAAGTGGLFNCCRQEHFVFTRLQGL